MKEKRPPFLRAPGPSPFFCNLLLGSSLGVGVVLFVVDVLRSGVLFLVDLLLLARGQLPAVRRAVRLHLLVDAFLLILELGGLARGKLPALDSLSDAILLVFAALADRVVAVVSGVGVVLVLINLLGNLILLPIDLLLFALRQHSAIRGAVCARLAVDGRFLGLQVGGFSGSERPALDAIRDTVLLIFLPLRNRRLLRGS